MVSTDARIEQLNFLVEHYYDGVKARLARRLGLTNARIGMWFARGYMDVIIVAECFPELSAEWLLRGTGGPFDTQEPAPIPIIYSDDMLREENRRLREENAMLKNTLQEVREEKRIIFDKLMSQI